MLPPSFNADGAVSAESPGHAVADVRFTDVRHSKSCDLNESGVNMELIPTYMECDESELEAGLYLGLFHGRASAQQDMSGWGFNGPLIGPLIGVCVTYCKTLKPTFVNAADCSRYFADREKLDVNVGCIDSEDDCLVYRGKFYGDWTLYSIGPKR